MTTAFKREAEAVLRGGGYEQKRLSGKLHAVWTHPDANRPAIHVPGTPRDPDYALVRLRRAVRVGSTPHIPQGLEFDVPRAKAQPQRPLHELLVIHATPAMQKRLSAIARDQKPEPLSVKDLGTWMRKCIQSHGTLPNAAINQASNALNLSPGQLSDARGAAGAVSFRPKGGARFDFYTDFAGRVPEDAFIAGRAKGTKNKKPRVAKVVVSQMPQDPDQPGGRRLDQGDLTPEQHAEAERMMRESTELADRELAEARRIVAEDEAQHVPVYANGNGERRSQLEIAMQLVREAALADTHALTEADLLMLRGTCDSIKRTMSDLEGMAAGLNLLLTRVDRRETVH